jgi:hypothetical protein
MVAAVAAVEPMVLLVMLELLMVVAQQVLEVTLVKAQMQIQALVVVETEHKTVVVALVVAVDLEK